MFVESCAGQHSIASNTFISTVDFITSRLSPEEQQELMYLRQVIASHEAKSKKNFGLSTFFEHLTLIHRFVVRGDTGDAYRGFVCGIYFGEGFLLVNTTRLKKLICRSKSCVNGCFHRLGFCMGRSASQSMNDFFQQILPGLNSALVNTRQWCMRTVSEEAVVCFIPCFQSHPTVAKKEVEEKPEKTFMFDIKNLLNQH